MRTDWSSRSGRRRLLLAAVLGTAGATGCSTLRSTIRGYEIGPDGMARPQHRLREALAAGDFVRALAWHEEDVLLDRLTRATSAYYAGQLERAGALLDTAALESDDRITERLSRDALALVTNDLARPYRPGRTERLFIPYYGMLAYVRAAGWEDAAVEARRLLSLVALADDGRDVAERPLHAAFAQLAGGVLARAGRADESRVAYRAAHRILEAAPLAPPPGRAEGELLVVLERGFVAHRITETIELFVGDEDARRRRRDPRREPSDGSRGDGDDDGADDWLAIALPALRRSGSRSGSPAQLDVDGTAPPTTRMLAVVDDAAEADERRERLAMLARATARAGAKRALSKAVKDGKGELAGTLATYGASLLERADVRSWHLLPQTVELLRARVPAGTHVVRVTLAEGDSIRTLELGTVVVRPAAPAILTYRVWREAPSRAAPRAVATRDAATGALTTPP